MARLKLWFVLLLNWMRILPFLKNLGVNLVINFRFRAVFYKEDEFFIAEFVDIPEVFTHDVSIEKLKQGMSDSFLLYFDLDEDIINVVVDLKEDKGLEERFARRS